ncbi:MAG: NAD(P)H-dependent oxidoreductase [Nocardioidaceae bacterium]|nr:NAD(P)H-dependent oxidoreductase [Nocardioidaceae bacterium]
MTTLVADPPLRTAVVVGNPRPGSRTLAAAEHVARELSGSAADLVVDLASVGPALLDWSSPEVADLVRAVGVSDLVVVASPTFKATYSGLLKLFLDRFDAGTGLPGLAVPLLLGAGPGHALAAEVHLRPLLVELGATVPGPALYVLDRAYEDPSAYADWLERARPVVQAWAAGRTAVAR